MKRKGKIWFFVVAILIVFLTVTTVTGLSTRYGDTVTPVIKSASEIRFGIDIRGGVDVTFVPQLEEGRQATAEEMASAKAVIEQRLLGLGISDYELYTDDSKGRLILRFPWRADETEFDPEAAIRELGTAAVLTFREGAEQDTTTGEPTGVSAENVILEGADVARAESKYGTLSDPYTAEHYVELTLTEAGAAKFAEATARLAAESGTISIWLDNQIVSAPTVQSTIPDGTAYISGSFDAESAKQLADTINAGSLPFALNAESYSTISPTLGSQSLRAMVIAGIIALILVAIFMIFNYRLPGTIASISLVGQTAATIAVVSGYFAVFPSSTLTLPGIAGIILAIGMGVDANVITAERIREELRGGKKLDAALKAGFQRGLTPIIDGNVTVLIVAAILMGAFGARDSFFGTLLRPIFFMFGSSTAGTIYSFGYTLMAGVLLNFVFGVFGTRIMLTAISKFKVFRNPVFYGGLPAGKVERVEKPFAIVNKRKRFFGLSGVLMVLILVFSFVLGVQLDVQFKGGAIISYSYTGTIELEKVQGIAEELLGNNVTLQEGDNIATGGKTLTITMPGSDTVDVEKMEELTARFTEAYPSGSFQQLEVNNVNPSMGREFLLKCVVAVLAAAVLILIYVAFRFRRIGGWRGGLTAVVALVHDLVIVYGVFVILQIPLNGNFIAAMLTILGYSINDTVVIYDRVRENRSLFGRRMPFGDLVNLSINQSLKRSVNTTLTTLVALGCVCIFSLVYGLDSIFTFAFPMMIGMISGVYSTVCIAGPLWVAWSNKLDKSKAPKKQQAVKAAAGKELPAKKAGAAAAVKETAEETKAASEEDEDETDE